MSFLESLSASLPVLDSRPISEIEQEIIDELEFHVEMLVQDNLRDGMSAADARVAALALFGDFQQMQRECRRTLLGERIMLQRLQVGLMLLLLAGIVAMGIQMYSMQRANRMGMQLMIQSLGNIGSQVSPGNPRPAHSTYERTSPESPIVIGTFPEQGAVDVDPETTEIRVIFDKPMLDRSWSWCHLTRDSFPETTDEPRYSEDRKTCILPVKLKSGKRYFVRFNSEYHDNFQDEENRPAVPHTLVFETRQ